MTNQEAINYLQQLYPNGGHCWLDEQRIEAIGMAVKALRKEPVSEEWIEELRAKLDSLSKEEFEQVWGKYRVEEEEEPVSEEIDEAANRYCDTHSKNVYFRIVQGPAFADGAEWMKQQMIKDATEVTVHIGAGSYPYIPQIELYDYDKDVPLAKEGDKYKVILIKEE